MPVCCSDFRLESTESPRIDMGPLVGQKRGFKTWEWIPYSEGRGGVVIWRDEDEGTSSKGQGLVWYGAKSKEKVSGVQGYEQSAFTQRHARALFSESEGEGESRL